MKIFIALVIALALGGGLYVSQNTNTSKEVTEEKKVVVVEPAAQVVPATAVSSKTAIKSGTYTLITNESVIAWEASKPKISGYTHTGTIGLKSGSLAIQDTASKGTFTIDMNTIKVTSLGGGKAGKESLLESHLKGDNFFGATTNPTGTFTVDSITTATAKDTYTVKGNLTLKGTTKPVEFPVVMTQSATGKVTAQGAVTINRTLWGITYGSGTFFDNLADNAIDDNIKLRLTLVAQ